VRKKWKKIPKELYRDGQISNKPNWGGTEWQNFEELVNYRDGLVHARASRPETSSLSDDEKPLPSKTDLDRMLPRWAVQRIVTLIRYLHGAVGTSAPDWLVDVQSGPSQVQTHKRLRPTALSRGVIEATDRQINALVYEVYGLTEEEIGVVEATDGERISG